MFDPKRYILAGGTVVVALGIGFVMQQSPAPHTGGDASPAQTASLDTRPGMPPVAQSGVTTDFGAMGLSGVAHTSANPEPRKEAQAPVAETPAPTGETELAAATPDVKEGPVLSDAGPEAVPLADACEPTMTATAAPAAMVTLEISVCQPDARVTIHHNGMMLSYLTDAAGKAEILVPALSSEALYIASVENGVGAVARAQVADFAEYERVVLQWRGEAGFQVHALEYGAEYGADGHVWRESPGNIARARDGQGGFLTMLGDPAITDGLRGEVYTFPVAAAEKGDVDLSAEAIVTEGNCTRDIEAQALQVGDSGELSVQDLVLTVPSCEVAGDILMLKNLLQDLKIARN